MPTSTYVKENGLAAMLASKRSAGVTPEVNIWECVRYTSQPSVNKAADYGFETQRRLHHKVKQGYQLPHKNHSCP